MTPLGSRRRRELAIDLGTANTLVFVCGRGIVVFEPSVVAVDEESGRVQAVGEEARRMIGRTPATIRALRPLRHGVIADFEVTAQMLRYFIRRAGGPETAEAAKIACGSAWKLVERPATQVAGRDRITGLLRRTTITSAQVRAAIDHGVGQIVDAVKRTLETTPPELAADISSNGIVLAGGGALLPGIAERIAAESGVRVRVANVPLECVALGAGSTLEERRALDRSATRRPHVPLLRHPRRRS